MNRLQLDEIAGGILVKETINNYEDLLQMLDHFLKEESTFNWDHFYSVRERNVPFFANEPDENLVEYIEKQLIKPGKVLELGCGPGRNAIYLAEKGFIVDAIDLSEEALEWGRERANERNLNINFIQQNIFDLDIEESSYDLVYDSGCFHHIAPHRRMSYLDLVKRALKPEGFFGITCFMEGGKFGGADLSDWEVYRLRSLKGGLGYTEEKLRPIFKDFEEIEIRKMNSRPNENRFGLEGLLTALFKYR
ncbi:class I SAM-dependent methyltransferase [Chungangia koreensis]|uniref:Class I SAM-dependent methyltransferase n=1 Tax=Chungangia koreensis TaxID=752657 RepID=A0ABV8WZ34_9LACT